MTRHGERGAGGGGGCGVLVLHTKILMRRRQTIRSTNETENQHTVLRIVHTVVDISTGNVQT